MTEYLLQHFSTNQAADIIIALLVIIGCNVTIITLGVLTGLGKILDRILYKD